MARLFRSTKALRWRWADLHVAVVLRLMITPGKNKETEPEVDSPTFFNEKSVTRPEVGGTGITSAKY